MYFGPVYNLTYDQRTECRLNQKDYAKKVSKMIKNREYTVGTDHHRITFRIVSVLAGHSNYDVNEYRLNVEISKIELRYRDEESWSNRTPYKGERLRKYDINRYKEFIQNELGGFLNIFGFGHRYGQGASIYLETPKIINRR